MRNYYGGATLMLALSFGLWSCDEEAENPSIEVPETYVFEREGVSTVSFGGQTTRISMGEELLNALKDPIQTENSLLAMYNHQEGDLDFSDDALNSSDKSLRSKTAASADYFSTNSADALSIKEDFDGWISAQAIEVFPSWETVATPGTSGQIADGESTRYVSAGGVEYNQIVNKGLIGGLMADQMLNNYLSTAVLDAGNNISDNDAGLPAEGKDYTTMEHKWDEAYGYLYGASADPADPNVTLGDDDSFLNKYLGRVEDDEDFAGIADEIYQAFKTGRAAIVSGDYDLRDNQASVIREAVSLVIGVRAVYYLENGSVALENQNFGGAFHDLSEGLGFVYSLQFTRNPETGGPYVSKAEVDGYLAEILENGNNGLWGVTPTTLSDIAEEIALRFGITVDQAAN